MVKETNGTQFPLLTNHTAHVTCLLTIFESAWTPQCAFSKLNNSLFIATRMIPADVQHIIWQHTSLKTEWGSNNNNGSIGNLYQNSCLWICVGQIGYSIIPMSLKNLIGDVRVAVMAVVVGSSSSYGNNSSKRLNLRPAL